jgi:hypothetical protein
MPDANQTRPIVIACKILDTTAAARSCPYLSLSGSLYVVSSHRVLHLTCCQPHMCCLLTNNSAYDAWQ